MPVSLHVIHAGEFIRIDADEHLDLKASKEVLQGLAQACRKRGLDHAMLDLRGLPVLSKPYFTTTELAALAGAFREAGFSRRQRLAVLYRQDVYGGIRNFTFFSRMRGLRVQAFQEFESALHWLAEEQINPDELKDAIPIPVIKREAKNRRKIYATGSTPPTRRGRSTS